MDLFIGPFGVLRANYVSVEIARRSPHSIGDCQAFCRSLLLEYREHLRVRNFHPADGFNLLGSQWHELRIAYSDRFSLEFQQSR